MSEKLEWCLPRCLPGISPPLTTRRLESRGAVDRELSLSTWTAKAHLLRQEQAAILAEILLEIDPDDAEIVERGKYIASNGGDYKKLRGLPAIGRGVSGAVAGSDPVRALLAKERWQGR